MKQVEFDRTKFKNMNHKSYQTPSVINNFFELKHKNC